MLGEERGFLCRGNLLLCLQQAEQFEVRIWGGGEKKKREREKEGSLSHGTISSEVALLPPGCVRRRRPENSCLIFLLAAQEKQVLNPFLAACNWVVELGAKAN